MPRLGIRLLAFALTGGVAFAKKAAALSVLAPKLFRALCDPTRVALLVRVAESCAPCTVSEVASCCPIDISVVSRHLAQLREAGVLRAERRGKQVFYSARAGELVRTLRAIADVIERCCPRSEVDARSNRTPKEGSSR